MSNLHPSCLILIKFKSKNTLTDIVQKSENAHADKHCSILLPADTKAGEYKARKRFRYTIGHKVAQKDIGSKAQEHAGAFIRIAEGEVLIQEITEDTAENIVGSRRYPVAKMEYVIEQEHYAAAEKRVHNTDSNKAQEGFIEEFSYHHFLRG